MKKYLSIIAVAAIAACATSALAQGTVGYNNSSTTLVQQWTSATDSTLMSIPKNAGTVQLYYAKGGTAYTSWLPSMSPGAWYAANVGWTLGPTTPISPVAGRFNGGVATLNGVAAGAAADYVIIGWTGTAANFDAALAAGAMAGVSSKFSVAVTGGVDPLVPPPSLSATFTGMTVQPVSAVPEPSTFALAGLGAAALLIFRRRK